MLLIAALLCARVRARVPTFLTLLPQLPLTVSTAAWLWYYYRMATPNTRWAKSVQAASDFVQAVRYIVSLA